MANTTSLTGLSKDILREKYILEGSKLLLEIIDPEYFKLLTESNNSDILLENRFLDFYNKVINKVTNSKTKKAISVFFSGIPWIKKNAPQLLKLVPELFNAVKKEGTPINDVISALINQKQVTKEANDILTTTDPGNPGTFKSFSDKVWYPMLVKVMEYLPKAEGLKKALGWIATAALLGSSGAQEGIALSNNLRAAELNNAGTAVVVSAKENPTQKTLNSFFIDNNVTLQGQKAPGIYTLDDGETVVITNYAIQGKYAKGLEFSPEGDKAIDDIAEKIKNDIDNGAEVEEISLADVENNTSGDVQKATDTKDSLSKARPETAKNKLVKALKSKGVNTEKIKFTKAKTNPVKKHKRQKPGSNEGTGVIAVTKTKVPTGGEVTPPPTYDAAQWGDVSPIGSQGGETPRPDGDKTNITPIPPVTGDDFSRLNRTQQWAVVLSTINPDLNITKFGEVKDFKSIPNFENEAQIKYKDPKTRELAKLAMNLRKSPDAFLKRLPGITDIPLHQRAKAVALKPTDSRAQLQPTIKESKELFLEGAVEDIFSQYANDIKKNRIDIMAYIGTMYAKEGDPTVSVLDIDKISDEDKNQLQKKGGFTPRQKGNNYVFLKGRSAADVGAVRTNKIQNDTARVLKSISRNTPLKASLKRINNKDELQKLIISILGYINARLQQDARLVRTDLSNIGREYKPLKEEEVKSISYDVEQVNKIINSYAGLKTELDRINNREELKQLLRGIIPFLDPVFIGDKSKVRGAFVGASNTLTNKALTPRKDNGKNNPPTTPTAPTTEMQRMQELAGIKTR